MATAVELGAVERRGGIACTADEAATRRSHGGEVCHGRLAQTWNQELKTIELGVEELWRRRERNQVDEMLLSNNVFVVEQDKSRANATCKNTATTTEKFNTKPS
ncbi:hypothetical protein YC2023_031482 [Brassica napus]